MSFLDHIGFFKTPELSDQQITEQLNKLRHFPITADLPANTLDRGWILDVPSKAEMQQASGIPKAEAYTSTKERSFHFHRSMTPGNFLRLAAHEFTHGQQQEENPVDFPTLPLVESLITHRFREAHADTIEGLVCYHHWRTTNDKNPWDKFKNGRFEQARTIGTCLYKHADQLTDPDFWQPDNPAIIESARAGFKAYFTGGQANGHDYVIAGLYGFARDQESTATPHTRQDYEQMLGSLKIGQTPILGTDWEKVTNDLLLWPKDEVLARKIIQIEAKHPGSTRIDLPEARKIIPSDMENVPISKPPSPRP